ncbi:hypothetical protein [Brachyspira hampsonii]|uniref:Uncharacterized protein n=1 Tax=Brachyspira hampsonii 30446 TaxID=1289135 RepID=A0A2U4FJ34_9SPIR|nr:hypothetical protein [Brachyspira hampsonii]EKV57221.1 hypothetical protein A966_06200 [Brachyspira hampsonii 30446]MBW5388585.1 hypothetical protein [Brachyspira hampsonii]MBW5393660.1 hypothetical protein [Brachyspira hampsonii]OEJ12945.1 hypothetical protein A9495_01125 [Brachyspira hampsonii]
MYDFIFNKICSYGLEKKREKIKRKIDDVNAYRELAFKDIYDAKERYNTKLNEIVNFLNGIRDEAEMNFKPIVQEELYEVAEIIRKSYDLLFSITDYNAQIKILNYKKDYHRTEINFFKRRREECYKVIKILSLSKKKDARLKWFNEANGTNVKTIDELRDLRGSYYNIDLLIDLCEKDLKNYRNIKKLREYIKMSDKKIHLLYDKVKDIDAKIEKLRETIFNYTEDYYKLHKDYLEIINKRFNIEDVFPSYNMLINKGEEVRSIANKIKLIKESREHYFDKNNLIQRNNISCKDYNNINAEYLSIDKKIKYYRKAFYLLMQNRRNAISDLYNSCFKKIVKCKNGGYLVIINEKYKDSNIFIPDLSSDKETVNK